MLRWRLNDPTNRVICHRVRTILFDFIVFNEDCVIVGSLRGHFNFHALIATLVKEIKASLNKPSLGPFVWWHNHLETRDWKWDEVDKKGVIKKGEGH